MKLEGTHVYPVPVDAVITMLRDKSATVDKYEGMGHRNVVPATGRGPEPSTSTSRERRYTSRAR